MTIHSCWLQINHCVAGTIIINKGHTYPFKLVENVYIDTLILVLISQLDDLFALQKYLQTKGIHFIEFEVCIKYSRKLLTIYALKSNWQTM